MKDMLTNVLHERLKNKMHEPLTCTQRLRPVSEVVDKMTHPRQTGQMSLIITPLMDNYELLTAVFIDNYIINVDNNSHADMIAAMRESRLKMMQPMGLISRVVVLATFAMNWVLNQIRVGWQCSGTWLMLSIWQKGMLEMSKLPWRKRWKRQNR